MASYNRIVLMGNLTRDPQLSYTPANTAVCKFGIATNHKYRDRDGNMQEEVCFVDCTAFGRRAEVLNQYMSKGRPVLLEGRLYLGQWTTPEGEKRSKHEVIIDNFTFVGGRGDAGGGQTADAGASGGQTAGAGASGGQTADAGASRAPAGAPAAGTGFDGPEPPTDSVPF
jgi:single-strand DNA-binding protein